MSGSGPRGGTRNDHAASMTKERNQNHDWYGYA
jgi:hypothetical protein